MRAAFKGHAESVGLLLEAGADVNAASPAGDTALLKASEKGHLATIDLLKKAGAAQ
jgi:ankyrin repeat protein